MDWGIIPAEKSQGIKWQYQSNWGADPSIVAKTILKAVNQQKPRTRYLIGFSAKSLFFHGAFTNTSL